METKLRYKPIESVNGKLTEQDYDNYMISPGQTNIAKAVVINPFEQVLKETEKELFEFDDFQVNRKIQKRASTTWEKVFSGLLKFLEIRADDSRVYEMDELKLFDGLGYCISTQQLKSFVDNEMQKNTSQSEFPALYWPRMKKGEEYPTKILIPDRDFSKLNKENANIVRNAKNYCSGLEKQVVNVFKEANQIWHEQETGYNKDKLPKEIGGIKREREIGEGKYTFINFVREEKPQYKEIIDTLLTEIQDLENNVPVKGYKFRQESKKNQQETFVNIKNIYERLSNERLMKDDLIKIQGRYEIVP